MLVLFPSFFLPSSSSIVSNNNFYSDLVIVHHLLLVKWIWLFYFRGMSHIVYIILGVAMLSVFGVLVLGLLSMVKGGEFDKKYSNKLMKARVYLQGLALALLALAYFVS